MAETQPHVARPDTSIDRSDILTVVLLKVRILSFVLASVTSLGPVFVTRVTVEQKT
jgi:hypothetical protein